MCWFEWVLVVGFLGFGVYLSIIDKGEFDKFLVRYATLENKLDKYQRYRDVIESGWNKFARDTHWLLLLGDFHDYPEPSLKELARLIRRRELIGIGFAVAGIAVMTLFHGYCNE